jgi:hypothetical protein
LWHATKQTQINKIKRMEPLAIGLNFLFMILRFKFLMNNLQ